MIKNRKHLNIQCNDCAVSHLCLPPTLNQEEKSTFNDMVNKLHILTAGEHLYYQKEQMQYLFTLYEGCCKEYIIDIDGNEKINGFYYPGDLLALESLPGKKYIFGVKAIKETQFCAIPVDSLFTLLNLSPNLLRRFLHISSYKLQKQHPIPVTTNAKRRLAAFFLNVFYRSGKKEAAIPVALPMSRQDISNFLGLANETVSRILHKFQKTNMLKILNRVIYITDTNALKKIAYQSV